MWMKRTVLILAIIACCGQNIYNRDNICMIKSILHKYAVAKTPQFTVQQLVELFDSIRAKYCSPDKCRSVLDSQFLFNVSQGTSCDSVDLLRENYQCVPGTMIMSLRGHNYSSWSLSIDQINDLTPIILYELVTAPCLNHPHDDDADEDHSDDDVHADEDHSDDDDEHLQDEHNTNETHLHDLHTDEDHRIVWLGGIGAVIGISIVGLAVIGIIPLIKKSVYNVLIQYLVALAVGTLVGDALLHLIPHALMESGGHDHSSESSESRIHVWRGFVSLMGILLFFNAERIIGIFTMKRNEKKKRRFRGNRDAGVCGSCGGMHFVVGHSSHEIHEMAIAAHKEYHEKQASLPAQAIEKSANPEQAQEQAHKKPHKPKRRLTEVLIDRRPPVEVESQLSTTSKHKHKKHKKKDRRRHSGSNSKGHVSHKETDAAAADLSNNARTDEVDVASAASASPSQHHQSKHRLEEDAGNAHSHKGRGHSHEGHDQSHEGHDQSHEGHGHSHEVPDSVSSMAFMVMMGDGLHNFTDGLAIGAAFANSFTGGMSTAVAVLCHELPHELGDFAILLKSGMSIKQAFMCNLLSAALQVFGAVLGIAVGGLEKLNSTQWLFAFAGGIFLYIGLVDMLPEIIKVEKATPWRQLLLQNAGLGTGIGIMLLIAIFESDLENLFTNEPHEH